MGDRAVDEALPLTLYSFEDGAGRTVIVSSLEDVPAAAQGTMRVHDPQAIEAPASRPTDALDRALAHVPVWWGPVHVASVGTGALAAIVAIVAWRLARRHRGAGLVLSGAAVLALMVSAYLAWVLRAAGMETGAVATPQDMIDHAQGAADATDRAQARRIRAAEDAAR